MKLFLILALLLASCSRRDPDFETILKSKHGLELRKRLVFELSDVKIHSLVAKVTYYSNRREETDDSPNITASSRFVYEGSCAISPDLKSKFGLSFGDLCYVEKLDQYFVIEDVTNSRLKETVDIFSYEKQSKTFRSKIWLISFKK